GLRSGLVGGGVPRLWLRLSSPRCARGTIGRNDRGAAGHVDAVAGGLSRAALSHRAGLLRAAPRSDDPDHGRLGWQESHAGRGATGRCLDLDWRLRGALQTLVRAAVARLRGVWARSARDHHLERARSGVPPGSRRLRPGVGAARGVQAGADPRGCDRPTAPLRRVWDLALHYTCGPADTQSLLCRSGSSVYVASQADARDTKHLYAASR